MSVTGLQKYRSFIAAVSVAALTAVGAWTGAALKPNEEIRQTVMPSASDRLQHMERLRDQLAKRSSDLEAKIAAIEERARSKPASATTDTP